MGVFQILWVYYGLLIASRPVIVWNILGVAINSIIVWSYFRLRRASSPGISQPRPGQRADRDGVSGTA